MIVNVFEKNLIFSEDQYLESQFCLSFYMLNVALLLSMIGMCKLHYHTLHDLQKIVWEIITVIESGFPCSFHINVVVSPQFSHIT